MTKENFTSSIKIFFGGGGGGKQVEWLYKIFIVNLVLQIKVFGGILVIFKFQGSLVIFYFLRVFRSFF